MSIDMKDYLAYQDGYEAGKRDAAEGGIVMEMPVRYIQQGWQCPVCGRVYAPWVSSCDCNQTNVKLTSNLDWERHELTTLEQITKTVQMQPKKVDRN